MGGCERSSRAECRAITNSWPGHARRSYFLHRRGQCRPLPMPKVQQWKNVIARLQTGLRSETTERTMQIAARTRNAIRVNPGRIQVSPVRIQVSPARPLRERPTPVALGRAMNRSGARTTSPMTMKRRVRLAAIRPAVWRQARAATRRKVRCASTSRRDARAWDRAPAGTTNPPASRSESVIKVSNDRFDGQ